MTTIRHNLTLAVLLIVSGCHPNKKTTPDTSKTADGTWSAPTATAQGTFKIIYHSAPCSAGVTPGGGIDPATGNPGQPLRYDIRGELSIEIDKEGRQSLEVHTDPSTQDSSRAVTMTINNTPVALGSGSADEKLISELRKADSASASINHAGQPACSFTIAMQNFMNSYTSLLAQVGCRLNQDHVDCTQPQMNPRHQ